MKILPVSILKVNNCQNKVSSLSKYSQRFLTSQIRSVIFNFNRIFEELDMKKISKNQEFLKKTGIKKLGTTKEKGIVFSGFEYNYHVFLPDNNSIQIELINKKSKQIAQGMLFKNNNNEYIHAGGFSEDKIEEIISETLDEIDSTLIRFKKNYNANIPYIPEELTSEKIAQLNKTLVAVPRNSGIKNFGLMDSKHLKMINSILKKHEYLKKLFKKIPNDTSRNNVRNYYNNYLKTKSTRTIGFKNIGPENETISMFPLTHKNKSYFVLTIQKSDDKELKYIISQEGKVQRNLPYREAVYDNCIKRKDSIPDYLTQNEIDKLELTPYLINLDNELKLFSQHTKNWLDKFTQFKKIHRNRNVGSTEHLNQIIEEIFKNFKQYKKNVIKYISVLKKRNEFKINNNISTEITTTSVTFKKITSDSKDLRLSFPTIPNKKATQILIMDNDNVEKSFYILDNKLLKFDIKNKSDRLVHYKRKLYFHDKKYLENSNLDKYLKIIKNKLINTNEKLELIHKLNKDSKK